MKITGRLQTFDRATGARLSNKKVDLTKKNRIPVLATGRRTYTIADVKVKYENFGRRERLPELEFERSEWEYFQSSVYEGRCGPQRVGRIAEPLRPLEGLRRQAALNRC